MTLLIALLLWMSPGWSTPTTEACSGDLVDLSSDPEARRLAARREARLRAAEVLHAVTLTRGFALEALRRSPASVAFAQTLFLATGYTLPIPPRSFWSFGTRIEHALWPYFPEFLEVQRALRRRVRGTNVASARNLFVRDLFDNLRLVALWMDKSGSRSESVRNLLRLRVVGIKAKQSFVPDRFGTLSDEHWPKLRRVLWHLEDAEVYVLVETFIDRHLPMLIENHYELARILNAKTEPEPNDYPETDPRARRWGRALLETIDQDLDTDFARQRLVPEPSRETLPGRLVSSPEMRAFLARTSPGPVTVESLRTVLSFVSAIQTQILRVAPVSPDWASLSRDFTGHATWFESLGRHLNLHRQMSFDREKILELAKEDLLAIEAWLTARRDQSGDPLGPRIEQLALGARMALEVRMARESRVRENARDLELVLSAAQGAVLDGSGETEALAHLEAALRTLASSGE